MIEPKVIQTLDIENNCTGIFSGDKFFFDDLDQFVKQAQFAWCHSNILDDLSLIHI